MNGWERVRSFDTRRFRVSESPGPSTTRHAAGAVGSGSVTMMLASLSEIGLDSNCLSYVIDALEGVSEPTGDLAAQRVALARLYLYTPGTLWTLPTVKEEFSRIPDRSRCASHASWTSVLFGVR